ncbi:15419_t:CDS:1, partial [Dentiscutata heterogama]
QEASRLFDKIESLKRQSSIKKWIGSYGLDSDTDEILMKILKTI